MAMGQYRLEQEKISKDKPLNILTELPCFVEVDKNVVVFISKDQPKQLDGELEQAHREECLPIWCKGLPSSIENTEESMSLLSSIVVFDNQSDKTHLNSVQIFESNEDSFSSIIEGFCSNINDNLMPCEPAVESGLLQLCGEHNQLEQQGNNQQGKRSVMEQEEEHGLDKEESLLSSQKTSHEVDLQDLSWLEELPFYCTEEHEADILIERWSNEAVSLFELLPYFIEAEILMCTSLGNNGDVKHEPVVSKSLLKSDSFDELLATLVEEDNSLTMDEESTWQVIKQDLKLL
ncbi:hypothetical protein SUGI_0350190 [Cryptomeria japonica]|nr:hypothetical protein SUGI_0350190 [Cryptomeria japonica]